jgi:hypothetical protein
MAKPLKSYGCEIFKTTVKAIVLSDRSFVLPILNLLSININTLDGTYCMMHMPQGLTEKGIWHRDENSDLEVIWIPLTVNGYIRLSYVLFSVLRLLSKLSLLTYKLMPELPSKNIADDWSIWRWNGRLIHMGESKH